MSIKAVLIGEEKSGKSLFFKRVFEDKFEAISFNKRLHFNFDFIRYKLPNGKKEKITLWDTSGAERYRQKLPFYVENAQALLIVADGSQPFEVIKQNLKTFHDLVASQAAEDETVTFFLITHSESSSFVDMQRVKQFVNNQFGYYPENCVYQYSGEQHGSDLVAKAILDHVRVACEKPDVHNQYKSYLPVENYADLSYFKKQRILRNIEKVDAVGLHVLPEIKDKFFDVLENINSFYKTLDFGDDGFCDGVNIKRKLYQINYFLKRISEAPDLPELRQIATDIQNSNYKMTLPVFGYQVKDSPNTLSKKRGLFSTKIIKATRTVDTVLARLVEDDAGRPIINLKKLVR